MKKFYFILLALCFTVNLFPQDLPHQMTDAEKLLWKSYNPQIYSDWITPPPTPVRTMAEWEKLEGVMITWTSFTSILRQIVDYAQDEGLVYIVCSDSNSVKNYLTAGGVPLVNLKFLITGFNSIWCRDYGPWSVYAGVSDTLRIIDWIYNRPRPLDDIIPVFFSNYINVPVHQTTTPPNDFIATGGNFMADGHGTGFSSKLILNENPTKTEAQIDTIMKNYMGLSRYILMNTLPYDVIHHIDMHMKLLDEETLLVGQYPAGVADGPQIEANLQYILNNFQTCFGNPFKVVRIPMPPDASGQYPNTGGDYRTYTNSMIVNKTVIIPTYEYQYDTTAFRIYREAMPGYRIVGINSNAIIPSLGTIHCIMKEVGSFEPMFISHAKKSGIVTQSGPVEIKAHVKTRNGIGKVLCYWTTDTTQIFVGDIMTQAAPDTFSMTIPIQPPGTNVYYYIYAAGQSGVFGTKPPSAPAGYYHFQYNVVPVELVSFTADISGKKVNLNWSTASELNNRGFEIERSSVINQWEKIAFVEGKGSTTDINHYSFTDKNLPAGKYLYRLRQVDFDGTISLSHEVQAAVMVTEFSLNQNYPNPFNPSTKISFSLPEKAFVNISVYNTLGQKLTELINEEKEAGEYSIDFHAGNYASGVYIYKLNAGGYSASRKMILNK